MHLRITVNSHLPPALERLAAAAKKPRVLVALMGKSAERTLRDHFAARGREPNKSGLKSTGWWKRIGDVTHAGEPTDTAVTVTIASNEFPPQTPLIYFPQC